MFKCIYLITRYLSKSLPASALSLIFIFCYLLQIFKYIYVPVHVFDIKSGWQNEYCYEVYFIWDSAFLELKWQLGMRYSFLFVVFLDDVLWVWRRQNEGFFCFFVHVCNNNLVTSSPFHYHRRRKYVVWWNFSFDVVLYFLQILGSWLKMRWKYNVLKLFFRSTYSLVLKWDFTRSEICLIDVTVIMRVRLKVIWNFFSRRDTYISKSE